MSARIAPLSPRPGHVVAATLLLAATAALTVPRATQPALARRAALRGAAVAAPAASVAPEDLGLDKDALRRAAAALAPGKSAGSGPPHAMDCGDVALVLDGFGGLGSSSAGSDAWFDAGSGPRASVFEAMAHLRNAGFLDADSLALPQTDANSATDGDAVIASYVRGPFRFDLRSELVDCGAPHAATLQQSWTITNVSTRAQVLGFSLYMDGDLFFAGDHRDDFGVRTDDALWQFDEAASRDPAAYLTLTSEAPAALSTLRQVGEYSDQRRRINRNELLREGLWRSTGATADADGDGVTDEGFDVSLAIQHDFGSVAPGGSVTVVSHLRWGVGLIDDAVPQAFSVSLGPDRVAECESHDGTLVTAAATSEPAGAATAWAWTVDGSPVAGLADLATLLGPGAHEIAVSATDAAGRIAEDSVVVTVQDTLAPEAAVSSEIVLWPPDHRMVPLELPVVVRDGCSDAAGLRVLFIESSEPADVRHGGDGATAADTMILGGRAFVRRERQGDGGERVYTVLCEAFDGAGNVAPVTVIARVPHDGGGR